MNNIITLPPFYDLYNMSIDHYQEQDNIPSPDNNTPEDIDVHIRSARKKNYTSIPPRLLKLPYKYILRIILPIVDSSLISISLCTEDGIPHSSGLIIESRKIVVYEDGYKIYFKLFFDTTSHSIFKKGFKLLVLYGEEIIYTSDIFRIYARKKDK